MLSGHARALQQARYQEAERVAALLGASAGTSPAALAEPDLESRASTDPRRAALPSANDLNVWSGRALQSVLNSK
jgi:hypothetical protein